MSVESFFAQQGLLSKKLSGYQVRPQQKILATKIEENIQQNGILLAEAGTGVGKTFAYLLPAFLSGKKALVSTATKNLQEQIFTKDLPFIINALEKSYKIAILKGRNNYLCPYYFEIYLQNESQLFAERSLRSKLVKFASETKDGDLNSAFNLDKLSVLSKITASTESCWGRKCPVFDNCFVEKARKKAQEADLIVVNHHLLLADLALRENDHAKILPDIDVFLIDEAHHLPKTALTFLGERLSYNQMQNLYENACKAQQEEASNELDLQLSLRQLPFLSKNVFASLSLHKEKVFFEDELLKLDDFWAKMRDYCEHLQQILRLINQIERVNLLSKIAQRIEKIINFCKQFSQNNQDIKLAKWLEVTKNGFVLSIVPVSAADNFAVWLNNKSSWVFLSATLSVDQKFNHFKRELGIKQSQEIALSSPFDYQKQAILYQPNISVDPNHYLYLNQLLSSVLPILDLTGGRAFLLFTSYKSLYQAENFLQNRGYSLLVQGSLPKNQLLKQFTEQKKAVLLATSSFWEGVDVRGNKLVFVMLDKLPFVMPDDPLNKARHRYLQELNLSPFMVDTLPQAVISLKQGVGRLIRDIKDYGVLVIGDPRLNQKGYGKTFLASLPNMTKTNNFSQVKNFFQQYEG